MGAACDADLMAATRDICRAGNLCQRSRCGDAYVDAMATPAETCDDGNTTAGDGCSATCTLEMSTTPPTGFRLTSLKIVSPRITVVPFIGCADATENKVAGMFSVNASLAQALSPTTVTTSYGDVGTYSLHIVDLFRPLNTTAMTTPNDLQTNPTCVDGTPDTCTPAAVPDVVMSIANNRTTGTCFTPVAAEVNTRAGTPATYTPAVNTVSAPCFSTDPRTLTINVSGIAIPLTDAQIHATYAGGAPPTTLVSGVVRGFLSERAAADILLPATLPLVGGTSLYTHLQAANRTTTNTAGMTIGDGCNISGGTNEDDADMNGTTRGFWFFLNFTAERVNWTGP